MYTISELLFLPCKIAKLQNKKRKCSHTRFLKQLKQIGNCKRIGFVDSGLVVGN